jgi:outer membrane cobalamin receptor
VFNKKWGCEVDLRNALLLLGALGSSSISAQPSLPLEDVVVITSRIPTASAASPYRLEILPEADLRLTTNVGQALSGIADMYVQTPGGRSGIASIFMRGADPNFAAVLLEGVPLNNPTNTRGGSTNVSEIEPDAFSRIEVATGALSGLYGSGALAGVINLQLPAGTADSSATTTLGVGTQDDYSVFARGRGPLPWGYGGSLALSIADDGEGKAGSTFAAQSLTAKIAPLDRNKSDALVLRVAQTQARAFPDSSGGDQYAELQALERRDSEEALIGVTQSLVARESFQLQVAASAFTRRDETEGPGVAPSVRDPIGVPEGVDHTRYTRLIAQTVANFDVAGWQAAGGIEAQQESGRSEGELRLFGTGMPTGFDRERSTYSGFLEVTRANVRWTLNAGARIDHVDELGEHLTARTGVRYHIPSSRFSVRANASTGFKAPSLYALGNPFVGNPELDPETSRSWEAGIDWAGEDANSVAFTLFRSRFADLIDFVPGPPPHLDNRDVVISKGASAVWLHSFSDQLEGSLKAQYTDTRDGQTDRPLLNRPKWRANARLTWRISDELSFSGSYSFVGQRSDYAIPTGGVTLTDYSLLSLNAAWSAGETTLRFVLDNALDDDYEDSIGFTAPGRRARILWSRNF